MQQTLVVVVLACAFACLLNTTAARRIELPKRGTTIRPHKQQDNKDSDAQTRLIERQDHRYADGHYEYRYVLSNGDTRYERAYWIPVGKTMVLARKGYYSYPLPNNKYLTVFYTADHNGYHQDSSKFTKFQPMLPRSLIVPEHEPPKIVSTSTMRPPRRQTTTKRNRVTTRAPTVSWKGLSTATGAAAAVNEPSRQPTGVNGMPMSDPNMKLPVPRQHSDSENQNSSENPNDGGGVDENVGDTETNNEEAEGEGDDEIKHGNHVTLSGVVSVVKN